MEEIDLQLKEKLKHLIRCLESPLPSFEISAGWNEELRERWLQNFRRVLSNIENNEIAPDASIPRAMDFDGITTGIYLELGAEISGLLRLRTNQGSFDA